MTVVPRVGSKKVKKAKVLKQHIKKNKMLAALAKKRNKERAREEAKAAKEGAEEGLSEKRKELEEKKAFEEQYVGKQWRVEAEYEGGETNFGQWGHCTHVSRDEGEMGIMGDDMTIIKAPISAMSPFGKEIQKPQPLMTMHRRCRSPPAVEVLPAAVLAVAVIETSVG